MPTPIQLPDLAWSPRPMRQFQTHDLAYFFLRQLPRMALGSPRLLGHPFQTLPDKALLPLVAGLGADPIFLAERPKIERPNCLQRKLDSLFHRFTFFPRHRAPF